MFKYLLLKLAEEAGEVVVAAVKHRLHRTASTKRQLELEIGDLLAICCLLVEYSWLNDAEIQVHREKRLTRERKRLK